MQFFIFRAVSGDTALASERAGASLPAALAPWTYLTTLELDEGIDPPRGLKVLEALRLLDLEGYYLVPPDVDLEETDLKGT
jgi:hypothetical protein